MAKLYPVENSRGIHPQIAQMTQIRNAFVF